jgi:hypothetical protein
MSKKARSSHKGKVGRYYKVNKEKLKEALELIDRELQPLRDAVSEEKLGEICSKMVFLAESGAANELIYYCQRPKGHEGPHRTYYDWANEEEARE